MNILNESKILLESLDKIKETVKSDKGRSNSSLFKGIEIRKKSVAENKPIDISQYDNNTSISKAVKKTKKIVFRVTYMRSVIQFLDLSTILNISLVNKEFLFFIKSVYFFKLMNDAKSANDKIRQDKLKRKNKQLHKVDDSGLLGKLTGAFSYFGKYIY